MVFLYYVRKKNKQNYLKRLETDVEFAILFIASEIIGAREIISIAPMISEAMKRISNSTSVSSLFK